MRASLALLQLRLLHALAGLVGTSQVAATPHARCFVPPDALAFVPLAQAFPSGGRGTATAVDEVLRKRKNCRAP